MKVDETNFMVNFLFDQIKTGEIDQNFADAVKELWDKYKLPNVDSNCAIITAEFGKLGSLVVRNVKSIDEPISSLKYERGSYDYVSIISDVKRTILWTDYDSIEPYNRQGGLYADGSSFSSLGLPVLEKEEYREFDSTHEYISNTSFGIWGYSFNDYWKHVRFGMSIEKTKVDEFITELRKIIGK